MSAAWEDFFPLVLPYVTGCPEPTVEAHLRQAAIAFCAQTMAWKASLPPLSGNGTATSFTMVPPTDGRVHRLLRVVLNTPGIEPMSIELLSPDDGAYRMLDEGSLRPIAFTPDGTSLTVWPAQPTGTSIVATAVVKPSQTAAGVPDALFEDYAQDIADGALATLLAMPGKSWTDLATAGIKGSQVSSRKATVARIVERGQARSRRHSALRWF